VKNTDNFDFDSYVRSSGVTLKDVGNTFYCATTLDDNLVKNVEEYTTSVLKAPDSPDYSSNLVGEIYDGMQIEISSVEWNKPPISQLSDAIKTLSHTYVSRFLHKINKNRSHNVPIQAKYTLNDMWIVSQKAHDYNPPHSHYTASPAGLAGVLYLKVPPQIDGRNPDGCFQLAWGGAANHDYDRFEFSARQLILPRPGLILLFPKTMCHQVFPFRGDGERRCIAFNMNVSQMR
jgi:hypothetical protein